MSIRISRNYKADHWKALAFDTESDWESAIDIFMDRLDTRYLLHIKELLRHRTSGFAVLTLDCAIIETLEQFRRGVPETPSRKSGEYFASFLTQTSFSEYFSDEHARLFYKVIRCGLLHQSEAKSSLVKRSSTLPLIDFTEDRKGLIINAKTFHSKLEVVIGEYVSVLSDPESKSARAAFRKKMDSICNV
jgi:hypothetical protein